MKKFLVLVLFVVLGLTNIGLSQNYEVLHICNFTSWNHCITDDSFDGIIVYGEEDCDNQSWYVIMYNEYGPTVFLEEENVNFIIIDKTDEEASFDIAYTGCSLNCHSFYEFWDTYTDENPLAEPIVWKHKNESITLDANPNYMDWSCLWSTGEMTETIEVSEPGTYSVTITDDCGSATYSVEVRDNVDLYRATCDLLTNKNQVTWQVTPEQAEYITSVKVYRNTTDLIATVPYTDGSFTDDIGSESTQWQYHLVGVSVEGDDCPIPSYWKRTIHLDHVQGSQGNQILQWTPYEEEAPSKETVAAYAIYDVVNGEARHVIDVGNFTNVYSYDPADFSDSAVVAAVFSGRGLEDHAFSNMISMTAVGETPTSTMFVYPNPSNGTFTVEGATQLTIYNTLGQTIITSQSEDGTHSFSLSHGIYFVKSGEGVVKKVVVE